MSKLPTIGKRYKNKYNGKTYSAVTYLGSDPEISCRLCCENDLMSDLNSRPTNNNFDKDFEELQDQEPVKEHVKKSGKSLHEGSIWKPISELRNNIMNRSLMGRDSDKIIICDALLESINKQESLEQRITDLEKRLTN
jgi:hypothetical protein